MKTKTKQTTGTGTESEMGITQREFSREGKRRNRVEKVQGRSSIISRHKIDGERKNGIGNRGLKEFMGTTHGPELRGEECWRVGGREDGG